MKGFLLLDGFGGGGANSAEIKTNISNFNNRCGNDVTPKKGIITSIIVV